MNTFLNYLIEASIGLLVFYLVYYWLLRKETNFHFNRLYILIALLTSTLVPFFTFPSLTSTIIFPSAANSINTYWLPEIVIGNKLVENKSTITFWQIFMIIYCGGVVILLTRFLLQIIALIRYLISLKSTTQLSPYIIEIQDDKPTFSFFKFIVIGQANLLNEKDKASILAHEGIHISRLHTVDVLFVNLLTLLFWFNPIIYLFKKSLLQVHEFEADAYAASNQDVDSYCCLLAKVALHSAEYPIANHFNNALTLKRISMLKKTKNTLANWKKVIVFPLILLVALLIGCEDQIMTDLQTITDQSSIVSNYPDEVQKTITEIKVKNPNAEVIVVGVMNDNKEALENLDKSVKTNEIKSIHVVKRKQTSKGDYDTYIIIEKGSDLNQLAEFTADNGEIFTVVEVSAQPQGGMPELYELLGKNIRYPQEARSNNVEGKVFVEFIVNENGALSDFNILKGIGSGCDEEAIRALRLSPNWIPGKQRGKAVKQRMVLPVTFSLVSTSYSTITIGQVAEVGKEITVTINNSQVSGSKKITGSITDETGKPLSGVNIVVENRTFGTVSKVDGSFELTPTVASGRLVFSFIGYNTKYVAF